MRFSNAAPGNGRRIEVDINLTSLVDIMFNLLLFFMLSSSIAQHSAIQINLPEADSAEAKLQDKDLSIALSAKGAISVNNENKTADELKRYLEEMPKNTDSRVILRADKGALHGDVVQIMDLLHSKGISQISIATNSTK